MRSDLTHRPHTSAIPPCVGPPLNSPPKLFTLIYIVINLIDTDAIECKQINSTVARVMAAFYQMPVFSVSATCLRKKIKYSKDLIV